MAGRSRGEAMRKTNSRVSMLLIAILLGSLITWAPPVSAAGAGSSPDEHLQAQSITAMFDGQTESTTVYWSNIVTNDYPTMQQMQESRYLVYRHNVPLNDSVVQNLNPWANVSMCPSVDVGTCSGRTFQQTYPLPAGTNGTYYYAIVSYFENNDDEDSTNDYEYTLGNTTYSPTYVGNYVHGEANLTEGIIELTNDITAPFFVQANYVESAAATDISWVNLNTIVPDRLPEVGESAYEILVYRHTEPALRATWSTIATELIAQLSAGDTTYRYMVPTDTDADVFYSVTYLYMGYEDVRFLGTNTLANSIHEDNVAPGSVQGVTASFVAEPSGGTGNTTITWSDLESESGEIYRIWRSGSPINNTGAPGVELIGTAADEAEQYQHEVERGMLGLAYYAVTAADVNGNHNNIVAESAALQLEDAIEEDTFTPWIAEPTNVYAEYMGGGQTTITWTDQLGVEGEQYHVWRSIVQLSSTSNLEIVAELVATVPDSVETATVSVEDDIDAPRYYCVTSLARYSLSSDVYESQNFMQNCWGPIYEDTLRPSLAFMQNAEQTKQGEQKIALLQWVNDLNEVGETYQIWMNENDPFDGNEEITSGDIALEDGWVAILDPIPDDGISSSFTRAIPLEDGLDQTTWYIVTTTDQYGNINTQYAMGANAQAVIEDTTSPEITIEIENEEGEVVDSLRAGEYKMYIYSNEPLMEYPIVNVRTSDYEEDEFGVPIGGFAFTEQTSTVRASPFGQDNAWRFQFEVTDELDTSSIQAIIEIRDNAENVVIHDITDWAIDAKDPTLEVYAPSQESLYLYGEAIHVYGAVSDDVGIASVEAKFRYYDTGIQRETEWTAMTDLTSHSTSPNTFVFSMWEPAATFHDVGKNQRVTIRVTDTSGNQQEWYTQFTVDNCVRTFINYDDACEGDSKAVEPEVEIEAKAESYFDGPYLIIYALAAANVVLLLLTMMSVLLSSPDRKKKKSEEEDDDDWMREFMGGGDSDAGSPDDVRNDMASLSEDSTERTDEEDPFAKSEGRDRKRRTKKTRSEKVEEVEEDDDDEFDDDDFEDEDDDWDDDSGPKKKAVRKTVKRKAVRRK